MNKIDIKKIIEESGLEVRKVASDLFPENKHPKLALDRVMKGDAYLDSNQISKLSMLTGIPIQFLFSNAKWKSQSSEGIIKLTSGDYVVELNPKTNVSKIFHEGSLFHESLIHSTSITLSEYIEQIEKLILNK